jgi:hypothetical protein
MDWQPFVPGVVTLIAAILLRPFFDRANKRTRDRLDAWAASEGVTITARRQARFYEGPGAWRRRENQNLYRFEVRDAKGRARVAWVTVGDAKLIYESDPGVTDVVWG